MFNATGPMCHCLVAVSSRQVDSHNLGWTIFCLFGYLNLKILPLSSLSSHHFTCSCFGSLAFDSFFVLIFLQALCSAIWSCQWDVLGTSGNTWGKQICCKENLGTSHQALSFLYRKGLFCLWFEGGEGGCILGFVWFVVVVSYKSYLTETGAD